MTDEGRERPRTVAQPIHPEPLLARFWPAFDAYVGDLVGSGGLDCAFGFETSCGNAGGCDPNALSRTVRQHLGRFGWPIAEPTKLRPREIHELVELFYRSVALPEWEFCRHCEQRRVVGGDNAAAQAEYTERVNDLLRRFGQSFRLQGGRIVDSSSVPLPALVGATQEVESALADADLLTRSMGAPRAIDRVHTALHGYLKVLCTDLPASPDAKASITELFRILRLHHPAFLDLGGQRVGEVEKVLKALSSAIDALNPIRNTASPAHPGGTLGDSEATLVINAARTIFGYLHAKLAAYEARGNDAVV